MFFSSSRRRTMVALLALVLVLVLVLVLLLLPFSLLIIIVLLLELDGLNEEAPTIIPLDTSETLVASRSVLSLILSFTPILSTKTPFTPPSTRTPLFLPSTVPLILLSAVALILVSVVSKESSFSCSTYNNRLPSYNTTTSVRTINTDLFDIIVVDSASELRVVVVLVSCILLACTFTRRGCCWLLSTRLLS